MNFVLLNLLKSEAMKALAISIITDFLASTVKNPQSRKAYGLISGVEKLRDGCDSFLLAVKSRDTQELA